ncbi:hypothetical protein J26TS2_40370 [Shouchella clausii]|nr:hypothetical protein [Shouchella tritolerans]GIN14170.1 hypothetical protein J26TS2_40370 [Shouchella clausii]
MEEDIQYEVGENMVVGAGWALALSIPLWGGLIALCKVLFV